MIWLPRFFYMDASNTNNQQNPFCWGASKHLYFITMKKTKFLSLLFSMLTGLAPIMVSCSEDEGESPILEASTNEITLDAEGETQSFSIKSNVAWIITGNKSWLSVSSTTGKKNETIVLSAQQNFSVTPRICKLIASSNDGMASDTVLVTQLGAEGELRINGSTNTSLRFGADGGEKQQVSITANSEWEITNIPDWVRVSPVNGSENSVITVTVEKENFSDEDRDVTLIVKGAGVEAQLVVAQVAKLAKNCRVTLSNETIMWDGFAADLSFESGAVGYREAFFSESEVEGMTDRDIYNKLMQQYEYSESSDFTYSPGWVQPETKIIYCIAAYGSENNPDGSHKYGPMNKIEVVTKPQTTYADMYLNLSYTSSRWTVTTSRTGQYGQRCDEYYIYCIEGPLSPIYYSMASDYTYAMLAHLVFKPMIEEDPNVGYKFGPQDINYLRYEDQMFFACWGRDRDTKEFSSGLSYVYEDLSSDDSYLFSSSISRNHVSSSDKKNNRIISRSEIETLRNSVKMYKIQM